QSRSGRRADRQPQPDLTPAHRTRGSADRLQMQEPAAQPLGGRFLPSPTPGSPARLGGVRLMCAYLFRRAHREKLAPARAPIAATHFLGHTIFAPVAKRPKASVLQTDIVAGSNPAGSTNSIFRRSGHRFGGENATSIESSAWRHSVVRITRATAPK